MPLLRRRKLDKTAKDAYWLVVRDCLVDIFEVDAIEAQALSRGRRAALEGVPKSMRHDIVYHEDPLRVAENLSHKPGAATRVPPPDIDDPRTRKDFEAILARHGLI